MTKRAIENVVKILEEYEDLLSDGYKYYCGEDRVDKTLTKIAIEIVENIKNTIIVNGEK